MPLNDITFMGVDVEAARIAAAREVTMREAASPEAMALRQAAAASPGLNGAATGEYDEAGVWLDYGIGIGAGLLA